MSKRFLIRVSFIIRINTAIVVCFVLFLSVCLSFRDISHCQGLTAEAGEYVLLSGILNNNRECSNIYSNPFFPF